MFWILCPALLLGPPLHFLLLLGSITFITFFSSSFPIMPHPRPHPPTLFCLGLTSPPLCWCKALIPYLRSNQPVFAFSSPLSYTFSQTCLSVTASIVGVSPLGFPLYKDMTHKRWHSHWRSHLASLFSQEVKYRHNDLVFLLFFPLSTVRCTNHGGAAAAAAAAHCLWPVDLFTAQTCLTFIFKYLLCQHNKTMQWGCKNFVMC